MLKYTFKAEASGDLNLGLFPNTPARSYASLAERNPMAVGCPQTNAWPALTSEVPDSQGQSGHLSESGHSYRVKVDAGNTRLTIESHADRRGADQPRGLPEVAGGPVEAAERVMVKRSRPVVQHSGI